MGDSASSLRSRRSLGDFLDCLEREGRKRRRSLLSTLLWRLLTKMERLHINVDQHSVLFVLW